MVKLAALDLGSNSFHLLNAIYHEHKLIYGRRLKEKVQIGAGLDVDRNLSQRAINRGLDCLKSFRSHINEQNIQYLVAVGTNTLRIANNSQDFIQAAEDILQVPIRVISGKEEAKLIFSAVSKEVQSTKPGLVIDIGGGSTEFAYGDCSGVDLAASIEMGCVSYYQRFFADGKIYSENVRAAEKAARLEIEPIIEQLLSSEKFWIAGTSGTMQSIALLTQYLCDDSENTLTLDSINQLESMLLDSGHVEFLAFEKLDDNRRAILPAGLAIVRAIFNALTIEQIQICRTALCEGLLMELSAEIPRSA